MANLEYTATTDFNADGEFSECEVDMAWATLQVKALLSESSTNTITINSNDYTVTNDETFLSAVKAQHALNVAGTVAVGDCGDVSSLPLGVSLLGSLPSDVEVLAFWKMLEPAAKIPPGGADIIDLTGNRVGDTQFTTAKRINHDPASANLSPSGLKVLPESWGFAMNIPDPAGTLWNKDGDFTFHLTCRIADVFRIKISKGGSFIVLKSASYAKLNGKWFMNIPWPGSDATQYEDTLVDLFIIKESNILKIYVVNEAGELHTLKKITMGAGLYAEGDVDEDIIISDPTNGTNTMRISNGYFLNQALEEKSLTSLGNNVRIAVPPTFRFMLDNTDTLSGEKLIDGDTAEELKVVGDPLFLTETDWGLDNGFPFTGEHTYYAQKYGENNYLKYENFNLEEDFTLSFWFKARFSKEGKNIIYIDGGAANKFLRVSIPNKELRFELQNGGNAGYTSRWATKDLSDFMANGKDLQNAWHHITLVQSSNIFDVYFNGNSCLQGANFKAKYNANAGKLKQAGMTNCELRLGSNSWPVAIKDVSLIPAGVVRIDEKYRDGSDVQDTTELDAIRNAKLW
tara:strand:+ start:1350 stop:3062 length:1713 start_codon:yes stop_codon:yes gene_type:complete